jgi:hypothetical protein
MHDLEGVLGLKFLLPSISNISYNSNKNKLSIQMKIQCHLVFNLHIKCL